MKNMNIYSQYILQGWMNNQTVVNLYNGILLSIKKEMSYQAI